MKLKFILPLLLLAVLSSVAQAQVGGPFFPGPGTPAAHGGSTSFTLICTQNSANFYTTASCTTTGAAASGTEIAVGLFSNINCGDATSGVSSVTDSVGNTYTATTATATTTIWLCIYSSHLTTTLPSGDSITVHCATSSNCNWAFWGYNSVTANGTIDQANATSNSSGCTSCTVSAAGAISHTDWCYVIGMGHSTGQTLGSWSNGFTTSHATVTNQAANTMSDAYQQLSTGTPTSSVSQSVSNDFYGAIACYEQ